MEVHQLPVYFMFQHIPPRGGDVGDIGDMCSCVFRVSSFAGEGGTLPFGMFPITLGRREFRASRTRRYLLLRATPPPWSSHDLQRFAFATDRDKP